MTENDMLAINDEITILRGQANIIKMYKKFKIERKKLHSKPKILFGRHYMVEKSRTQAPLQRPREKKRR